MRFPSAIARQDRRCIDCKEVFVRSGDRAVPGATQRCHPCRKRHRAAPEARQKVSAQRALQAAVAAGRLTRPWYCQRCGKDCRPHGHHFGGYERRNALKVIWLCPYCHQRAHEKLDQLFTDGGRRWDPNRPGLIS